MIRLPRTFWRWALLLVGVAAIGGGLWVRLFAGGPVLPGIPGGWVEGTEAATLPSDWSFANGQDYLLVESRAGLLPWSGTVWFLSYQGRLHLLLPGFFGDDLQQLIARDPRVRVAIGGYVYPQVAVRVTSDNALEAMVGPVLRRQFSIEVGGPVQLAPGAADEVAMSIYRLQDPPAR